MWRALSTTAIPRAASVSRSLGPPVTAARATLITSRFQGATAVRADSVVAVAVAGDSSGRNFSWRGMSSASENAKVATGDDETADRGSGKAGVGRDDRDPETGEGMWIDEEDEPLVLEKPKKVQKFCGLVISDSMDKTIKVAVPYWYYVRKLGKRTIRHSKLMAHDEENKCNVGDRVILVDCKKKSKRKKHVLHEIVRKLPTLDD